MLEDDTRSGREYSGLCETLGREKSLSAFAGEGEDVTTAGGRVKSSRTLFAKDPDSLPLGRSKTSVWQIRYVKRSWQLQKIVTKARFNQLLLIKVQASIREVILELTSGSSETTGAYSKADSEPAKSRPF
jgi:hypothetical protein